MDIASRNNIETMFVLCVCVFVCADLESYIKTGTLLLLQLIIASL